MRIITFNIARARYAPITEIAAFIDALEPDVVLAQEVDRFMARSQGVDQHVTLTRLLGSAQSYFSTSVGNAIAGYYGTAVYLREPFAKKISRFNLTVKGDRESRFAIEAQLNEQAAEKFGVDVISNIHLSANSVAAETQVKRLVERNMNRDSFLIGGDFNLSSQDMVLLGYPDEDAAPTCGVPSRKAKLDRFLVESNRPHRTQTVPTGHLSDHDAVILDI